MTNASSGKPGMGRWMFAAMWVCLLLLLTGVFSWWLDGQRNPNQSLTVRQAADAVEVVLEENRQGHYWASGAINGQPTEFMLDTGATSIAIPEALARSLGLERGPSVRMQTANGVATGYMTRLERVSIGPIALDNLRAIITPGLDRDTVLLGMNFLGELEFERRDGRLVLRQYR